MAPRDPVVVPRKVVDFNTLQVLDTKERRQLFNGTRDIEVSFLGRMNLFSLAGFPPFSHSLSSFAGSYFSEKDPSKKNRGSHSFGYRRPMFGQPVDSSPGPGAYNVDPVQAVGTADPLSSTDSLRPRRDPPVKFMRTRINYSAPAKSFGRKNLIS